MTQRTPSTCPVTIGLDVGDRTTHFCVLRDREVVERGVAKTTRPDLEKALAEHVGARVVLEAGSQSPWMSRHLREQGFDVHVADPRRVQLISKDPRKTDRRDAEVLARLESGIPELLGQVHHRSEQAQADLAMIRARDQLVGCRTSLVQCVRSLCKAFGLRLPSASTAGFSKRVRELVPPALLPAVEIVLQQITALTESIRGLDRPSRGRAFREWAQPGPRRDGGLRAGTPEQRSSQERVDPWDNRRTEILGPHSPRSRLAQATARLPAARRNAPRANREPRKKQTYVLH